jgi:hypothetical protein
MFLVEEKKSVNGRRTAEIYMRPDGLFEGRIYQTEKLKIEPDRFELCGVAETLPRMEAIVDEELGL